MYNMPITVPYILLHKGLLLRHVLDIFLSLLWTSLLGKIQVADGCNDADKAKKFIQKIQLVHQVVHEQLEKSQAKYKARHDKHWVDHHFQVGDQVWLYISKECLKGEGKKGASGIQNPNPMTWISPKP
jgi:hypothetical protein